MAYFSNIPNLLYLKYTQNPFDGQWLEIKNIFSRIKVVPDEIGTVTVFDDYFIADGDRPDTISYEMYDDPNYDWTILLINNMISLYNDWPKSKHALDEYVTHKYQDTEGIHHYEAIEQKYKGNVVVSGGMKVDEAYQYVTPEGLTLTKAQSRVGITNYTYEIDINEKKREINLIKPDLIPQFNQMFKEKMRFKPSTKFINEKRRIA
tara:strand:- start:803 stop:1420 length:618 start_codon:yes stop_codon:yes gene_type:complete